MERVERRGKRGREEERWEDNNVDTTTAHMHAGSTSGVSTSVVCQVLCEFQGCRKRIGEEPGNKAGYYNSIMLTFVWQPLLKTMPT